MKKPFLATLSLLMLSPMAAFATPITLDFDTADRGSDLLTTPLLTPAGTISLSNATDITSTPIGSGDGVFHNDAIDVGFAVFTFDFDVDSIMFDYTGHGFGVFTGQVLDAAGTVLDSFFDPDTSGCVGSCGTVTLSGSGIRSFQFGDSPGGGAQVSIDNLVITPTLVKQREPVGVPEPGIVMLLGFGLAGMGFSRRKKRA